MSPKKESSSPTVLATALGRFHGEKLHGNRELHLHVRNRILKSLLSFHLTFFPHLNTHIPMTAPHCAADPTGDGVPGSSSPAFG